MLIGYFSGILHKLLFNFDIVIGLYALNFLMVFIDIMLYVRNRRISRSADNQADLK